jgi:hypothetical protein
MEVGVIRYMSTSIPIMTIYKLPQFRIIIVLLELFKLS